MFLASSRSGDWYHIYSLIANCLENRFSDGELFIVQYSSVTVRQQYKMIYAAAAHNWYGRFFVAIAAEVHSEIAPNYEWMVHGELIFDEAVYLDFNPLIYAMV